MVDKRGRLYIPKDSDLGDLDSDLGAWIADKIPPVPKGLRCEAPNCVSQEYEVEGADEDVRPLATSYSYRIEGDHVCYAYICDDCQESCDPDYLFDNDYPTTSGGYAVVPTRCS